MRFWDASAIVPLLVSEPRSRGLRDALRDDPEIVVWWGSRLECASALRRREREGALEPAGVRRALELLDELAGSWSEVLPTETVRIAAERALAVHPLRSADALQLAAALTWRRDPARRSEIACLDERLRDAAAREGFAPLPQEI